MTTTCPPDHTHGDNGTCYTSHACRCPSCTEWNTEAGYYRRHNPNRTDVLVDATGARRRIQALSALGWSQSALAPHFETTQAHLSKILRLTHIRRSTHTRIAAAYEHLAITLPPAVTFGQRLSIAHARGLATRSGWLPPLAWDDIDNDPTPPTPDPRPNDIDPNDIELALAGEKVRLTTGERREVVRRMNAAGHVDSVIAPHAGCDIRTVQRIRKTLRLVPVVLHRKAA